MASSGNTSGSGGGGSSNENSNGEQKFTKEQQEALDFLVLIIVACGAWVLLYFRAYVSWTLWVLLTHGLTYFAVLFVSAFIPGLSRFFGPARGPRESIQDHSKRWYAYITSLDTILYGFMLYAGLSVFDFLAGGILIWNYYKMQCFPFLNYYLVDLPTYFVGTIMWVLIVLVGHVTLVVSEFTVLSGFGPDLADGGDNPWWGGLEDLDFLGSVNSNLGDKNMTVEQARSYLGLKEGVDYDRKSMRKQYHRVCAKWHPDKNPNNTMAKQYFQKIQDAYELLGPKAMRNGRLKDLGKRSCKHVALFSALDLASSYVLGKGFIWVHAWPTFWFVWFVGIHCVFAYVLQQLVKSVASLPSLFSTYGKVFALVLTVSLMDYIVGSYTTYGKIIWSENWPFPYLMAAPSQIPALLDSLPFNALWLFRVYCSIRMVLRGFVNVSVQVDFVGRHAEEEKDQANAVVVFNGFLNICFTVILIILDFVMHGSAGWIWRSRKESGWFFVVFSFFWSWSGLDITQSIGYESWGDFLVAFVMLSPHGYTWFDAILGGFSLYILMRLQRAIIYTDFAMSLLQKSCCGSSILKFSKELKEKAEEEVRKQEEQDERNAKGSNNVGGS